MELCIPFIKGKSIHMFYFNAPWIHTVVYSTLKQTSVNSKEKRVKWKKKNLYDIVIKNNKYEDKWFPEKDWNVHL